MAEEKQNSILETLNEAQRSAVSRVTGPLLVVAGAGTGKTRVITARILHLLNDLNVPADRILALTFTEKAADEMLSRVDESMPLAYEEVTIKTFHGFCDMILRERGIEIGIDSGFKIVTEPEQWILIKNNLYRFELNYYRPLGNPNKFIGDLIKHFSKLKDEDISYEDYLAYAELKLKNPDGLSEAEKETLEKHLELARAYKTFQDIKIENNFLDFADLQFYALRMLEKRPSLLEYFGGRFKYILVDEFQDTNFAQNKLVMMLAKAGGSDSGGNLTVVGDDDQSIYKWRGASLTNIKTFEKSFPGAKIEVLTENFRSRQDILDVSYHVIQNNNPDRLEIQQNVDKKLVARGLVASEKIAEPAVQSFHFSHYLDEVAFVRDSIMKLVKDGGVKYRDIAVLVRTNRLAAPFIESFKDTEIPFNVRDSIGLLRYSEIKDLTAFLRFICNPHDDIAVFRLLSNELFDIEMAHLTDLVARARSSKHTPLFYFLEKESATDSVVASLPGMDESVSPFKRAYRILKDLLEFSRRQSVNRILGEFLDKTGYYKSLTTLDTHENAEKIQHIGQFIDIAEKFENADGEKSVAIFLDYLDSYSQAANGLSAETVFDDNSVSVLTVHSSKGLEFDYVFLPSLVAQRFPGSNRKDSIEIPSELLLEDLPLKEVHLQEERRLFYVACTRARRELKLSYADAYEGAKKWKISPFLVEAHGSGLVKENNLVLPENERGAGKIIVSAEDGDALGKDRLREFIPEINIKQLSYSKLKDFNECPLRYKFKYLFKIKTPQGHAASFGTSIHGTVNDFYNHIKAGESPNMDLLKRLLEKNWVSAGYDSASHEKKRWQFGLEVLEKFLEKERESGFTVPAFMEEGFRLRVGGATFTGRIDRIDKLNDGTFEIVDYKTGKCRKESELKKDLQLSLYALAGRDFFKIPVSKLSLYFIEDCVKISTVRSDEVINVVQSELDGIVKELRACKFPAKPDQFTCQWCDFKNICNVSAV